MSSLVGDVQLAGRSGGAIYILAQCCAGYLADGSVLLAGLDAQGDWGCLALTLAILGAVGGFVSGPPG